VAIRVFGLTGGIGSGKSTVARRFVVRGLPVIDADLLAREVVEPGSAGLAAVAAAFGPGVLGPGGELDRQRLGAAVFASDEQRRRLNAILHPLIRARFLERLRELDEKGHPLACYEVPLLFEVGLQDQLRPVVVVAAPEAQRVARIMGRDGVDEAAARARIAAQMPLDDKVKAADHVIDNGGALQETQAQADQVLESIAHSLGLPTEHYPLP
jgi:dephospho-CoA kinase